MKNKETEYLKRKSNAKLRRAEIWFAPVLIFVPLVVATYLIIDWFTRGYLPGNPIYSGELVLAFIILIGNILFDIPFVKNLKAGD